MLQTPPRNHFPVTMNRTSDLSQPQHSHLDPQFDKNITGQVDHYLETTYRGLITNKIDSLCKPEFAPTNSLLINYIRHIYSKYALEDPMKKYGDQRFWGSAETHSSSAQRQSASRVINQQRDSRITMAEGNSNPENLPSQSRYLTPEKSMVTSRLTGLNQTTITQGSADQNTRRRMSVGMSVANSQIEETKEIDAVFRYCFECEKSILEYNMLNHEKNCPGFMSLYQKSTEDIVQLLETKIERIKQEVISVLNSKEESKLPNLRQATGSWLATVELSQKTKVLTW